MTIVDLTETDSHDGAPPGRQLHLNAFLMTTGHHEASWRLGESGPWAGTDVEHYKHMARAAEKATFDSLFLADSPCTWGNVGRRPLGVLEPHTLLSALAGATDHIGLIATASTSYNSPYNLARKFASLDHVSGGRPGWNIVTTASPEAARNFGLGAQASHAERYQRAMEFVDVVRQLWDSWEEDPIVADKASGHGAMRRRSTHLPTVAAISPSMGPSTSPVPLRATRCSCRRGRPKTATGWRHATPTPSSPPSRPWRTPKLSMPTSKAARLGWAATPAASRSSPGSCLSSAAPSAKRSRRRRCSRTSSCTATPNGNWPNFSGAGRAPSARPAAARRHPRRGRDRGGQEQVHADRGARAPGPPHAAPAHRPARRRPGPPHRRRYARTGGRDDRGVVRERGRRRFQRHARGTAVGAGRLRRPRRTSPALSWDLPPGVRRDHPAPPLRPGPTAKPVPRRCSPPVPGRAPAVPVLEGSLI